jgi:tetratricopeptide (TPR) repeat protein
VNRAVEQATSRRWRRVAPWLLLLVLAVAGVFVALRLTRTAFDPVAPRNPEALGADLTVLIEEKTAEVRDAPHSARAHGTLGLVYEANHMWVEAQACFRHAATLAPDEAVWRHHLAICLFEGGQPAEALTALDEAIDRDPGFVPAWQRRGELLHESGRLDDAERAFLEVIARAPEASEGYAGLGKVLLARGDHAGAVERLERAIRLDHGNLAAHYALGRAYRALGRDDEARVELALGEEATTQYLTDPLSAEAALYPRGILYELHLAKSMIDEGRADLAIERLRRLAREFPEDVSVQNNLGGAYLAAGRLEEAKRALLDAIRLNPRHRSSFENLGECLARLRQMESALGMFDKAIALDPLAPRPHVGKARIFLAQGRTDDGIEALKTAIDLAPDEGPPRLFLAQVYLSLGRRTDGVHQLRAASRVDPASFETQVGVAEAFLALEDARSARQALATLRRLAPGHPKVTEIELRLSRLGR